jgi:integrase
MAKTNDVRVWKIEPYKGKKATTYTVKWVVAGERFRSRPYTSYAAADSFRSELLTAHRNGEPFDTETGLPASWARRDAARNWYDFACEFVDKKWAHSSAHHRRNTAETLMLVTVSLLKATPKHPTAVRGALRNYTFNTTDRMTAPADVAELLAWIREHSPNTDIWAAPSTVRNVMDDLSLKLDGGAAAASSLYRHRAIVYNALGYAVEQELLPKNPLDGFKLRSAKAKATSAVDKRNLLNSTQADAILSKLLKRRRNGVCLHAFFATLYYAGLRPEEAAQLHVEDLTLPPAYAPDEWGELSFSNAAPEIAKQWNDTRVRREARGLKGRAEGESRNVPVHPRLARILREYIASPNPTRKTPAPPLKPGDRLFNGDRGGYIADVTYRRALTNAREDALEPHEVTSRVGKTPYDFRHTCLTNWLNAGVPSAQVALWAGNSVKILLATYINCINGSDDDYKRRIRAALPD